MKTPYVEQRNQALYVTGTRVSLASVIHAFRRGASPESILEDFPQLGSLAKVHGAIAFILENPDLVESYLNNQERRWSDLERKHPLPPAMVDRFERARQELKRKPA